MDQKVAKKTSQAFTSFHAGMLPATMSPSTMDIQYRIQGGTPLKGVVSISGSKNAALPLLAATVCCKGDVVLHNVPELRDITTMLSILDFLGAKTSMERGTVTVNTDNLQSKPIPHDLVSKLRGCIVLLGPLLARFGEVEMAYPGGCVLGKRPVNAHIEALVQLGATDQSSDTTLKLKGPMKAGEVILPEFSVTATENVMLAAALIPGETRIELAAAEPHVQDLAKFVSNRSRPILGSGSHTLVIHGKKGLMDGGEHRVVSDYLEAGAFILAGILTKGMVTVKNAERSHLISFLGAIKRAGGTVDCKANGDIIADGTKSKLKGIRVQTNIFPGFPTDLQAPFGVLLTQAEGVSRIFEVLFEGRMAYLYELEKMGAHIEILNSHQALVIGPTQLRGRSVPSNDIRAGVAMVLAGLTAEGETIVTDVRYIERGYDCLEKKLKNLGANIVREEV